MTRIIFISIVSVFLSLQSFGQDDRPSVGAIRWDAWLGHSNNVGAQVNTSLGPNHFHWRLPFYSRVIDSDSVDIDGNSQLVADAEIEYAAYSELDYFAFLMYDEDFLLSNGLKNYLSSSKKSMINFCVIMNDIDVNTEPLTYSVQRTLSYMEEATYQKVLDERPLVYTFRLRDKADFAIALKDSCAARGWNEPYIVDLHWTDEMPSNSVYDAISRYWYDGNSFGGATNGAPYSNLMSAAQTNWELRSTNNAQQVPLVSLGADGRPRIENPVSWIADPISLYQNYFETPTPQQFVTHLGQAFDFIENNPLSCEARTALLYAWNENDEGGWLMPTLENDTDTNTTRIDSLRSFLLNYEYIESTDSLKVLSGIISDTLFNTANEIGVGSAFDGNVTTYASYEKSGGFCQMEFSQEEEIHAIRYYPRPRYQTRLTNAVFQISNDGSNWTTIHTIDATPASGIWTEVEFSPSVNAKFVRLIQPTNWLTISEIEFIGAKEVITNASYLDFNEDLITIHPNPASELITVDAPGKFEVIISDIKGGVVHRSKDASSNTKIDISNLLHGTYLIRIFSPDNTITKKLIKM
jgi:hypothetical protein